MQNAFILQEGTLCFWSQKLELKRTKPVSAISMTYDEGVAIVSHVVTSVRGGGEEQSKMDIGYDPFSATQEDNFYYWVMIDYTLHLVVKISLLVYTGIVNFNFLKW